MVTLFPFPGSKPPQQNTDGVDQTQKKPPSRSLPQAYFLEGNTGIGVGSGIAVELLDNVYRGTLLAITEKDANGNISKITYNIKHLESGGPLKIGEAHFKYIVKSI
jgi:hypothetical protein